MSVEKLREYVGDFRRWIETHGKPAMPLGQSFLLTRWREELAAAEQLLEANPELPIAFLGPSQQGKSSLINALLDNNILAVGGAVGACTCVITSVHYRSGKTYRAEIDFISDTDWRAELLAMREAFLSQTSEEDTEMDREEREADQKAAGEKFNAVYRDNDFDRIRAVLKDENLGLPRDIVHAMASNRPIIIEEESALTLRNKVRRYLVGREQHEDGQFWPLISRVRIYGNFDVLFNGVVLVDLPGLNDPNPAREHVTKRYLNEARYIWLICNSQTGIDRVFAQLLRENGLLFRLFLEGRLGEFSVVTTRVDDINLEAILAQMGVPVEDYDGDYTAPLAFRRKEIASHVHKNLLTIAADIVSKAAETEHQEAFLDRIRNIPVFSVSTAAYLHSQGLMPLYKGMRLSGEESHLPLLIAHLTSITLQQSYQAQIEASCRRLEILHNLAHRFFLTQIQSAELDSATAKTEFETLSEVGRKAVVETATELQQLRTEAEAALHQRCEAFDRMLQELERRAGRSLEGVFGQWETINWRSLQAAVRRNGEWFSRALQREFNLSRDIARAYLDLLPFAWDDFFGRNLSTLITDVTSRTETELHKAGERIKGALDMIRHQPNGVRDSIEESLSTARESFKLQSAQVGTDLTAQIQRTRQSLSNGMVETAATFMQPAYAEAAEDPGGAGIKRRMLTTLTHFAEKHAPSLFINMRKELADGIAILQGSMKPQLSKLVAYGDSILDQFRENIGTIHVVPPELKKQMEEALKRLPPFTVEP